MEMRRPLLFQYCRDTADVLTADFNRSKGQNASANIGRNREFLCRHFLDHVVPPKLSTGTGEMWDAYGNQTGQLDIVLYRNDSPRLHFGDTNTFPVQGVFGVVEVKSNLTTTKLQEAFDTSRRVKVLNHIPFSGITAHYTIGGVGLNRPLCCVFAYTGARLDTLYKELSKPENIGLIDVVSVLDRGAICSNYQSLNLGDPNKDPFSIVDGKAGAIGMLYRHIVIYSTAFLAQAWQMDDYFVPLQGWVEM